MAVIDSTKAIQPAADAIQTGDREIETAASTISRGKGTALYQNKTQTSED